MNILHGLTQSHSHVDSKTLNKHIKQLPERENLVFYIVLGLFLMDEIITSNKQLNIKY